MPMPCRGRNRVEPSVGRLKQFRRVATRYDKRARNYPAWVTLAAAVIGYDPCRQALGGLALLRQGGPPNRNHD